MCRCAEGRGLARHCGRRYLRRDDRALCPEGEGGRDLQLEHTPLFALWGRGDSAASNAITDGRMPELGPLCGSGRVERCRQEYTSIEPCVRREVVCDAAS